MEPLLCFVLGKPDGSRVGRRCSRIRRQLVPVVGSLCCPQGRLGRDGLGTSPAGEFAPFVGQASRLGARCAHVPHRTVARRQGHLVA